MSRNIKFETVNKQGYTQFFMFSLIIVLGFFASGSAEAAGWGTMIYNKISDINTELKIIGGGLLVLAIIWLALTMMLGIERDHKGKAMVVAAAGILIAFSKDIADMILNIN